MGNRLTHGFFVRILICETVCLCNSLALTQNIPCGLNNHISRAKIGMIAKKRSQDVPSWNSPLLPALCRARRGRKYRTQEILPWVKYDDPRLSVANWERLSISPNKYIYPFRRTTPNGFRIFLFYPKPKLCGFGARDIFCFSQIIFRVLIADSTTRRLMRVGR